jgi:hypothetical protein
MREKLAIHKDLNETKVPNNNNAQFIKRLKLQSP